MEDRSSPTHPVLTCANIVEDAVKAVADVDPVFMSPAQKREALLRLTRLVDQLAELHGRVLACAEDVALDDGARDAASWLAHHARLEAGPRRALALSEALSRWALVAAGVREGTVNQEQAVAIAHALDQLPTDLDPAVRAAAEARLVTEAAHFGPRQLRTMGRRILDIIDPQTAESREAEALDKEEREARRRTYLRWRRNGDGTVDFRGRVSDAVFTRLLAYLEAFTSPRHKTKAGTENPTGPAGSAAGAPEDRRPYDQRMGSAFGSFLEAVDPARLPLHGGDATTLIVTIDYDKLRSDLAAVGFIGDEPITAAHTRRLACTAGILPAILNSDSQVLDLGRTQRLATPAQRKALAARFPRCQATGCTIPNTWCEAHHRNPWSHGGNTNLTDLILLCTFHHHRTHDGHHDVQIHPTGDITFHRRT